MIGERVLIEGFGLAGALMCAADEAAAVREAWHALPDDVAVAILTRGAADSLGDEMHSRDWPLVTVME